MCSFLSLSNFNCVIFIKSNGYFFIHSSVDEYLGCFHVLAIVNSAVMNNGIHVSFSILVSAGYMPTSGIAGSYGGFQQAYTVIENTGMGSHSLLQGIFPTQVSNPGLPDCR